jgi:hypothetical protein
MNREIFVNALWFVKDVVIKSLFFFITMVALYTFFPTVSPLWYGIIVFLLFYWPLVQRLVKTKEKDGYSHIIYKFKRPANKMKFKIVEETYEGNAWLGDPYTYYYALVKPYYFAGYFAIKNTNLFTPIYPPYREVTDRGILKLHYSYRVKKDAEKQINKFKEYAVEREKADRTSRLLSSKTTKIK